MAPLTTKLGIRPGDRALLLDAPPDSAALLRRELSGATLVSGADDPADDGSPYDAVLFWPTTHDGLTERFVVLQARIRPGGVIWAVIPKKRQAAARGVALTWEQMQAAALLTDLVDNKIASISEVEYGTRFVIRAARRHRYPATADRA